MWVFVSILIYITLFFGSVPPSAAATLAGYNGTVVRGAKSFRENGELSFACLGDSWASGERYSKATTFDNNKDDCHRLTHAYCPLLDGDKSWTQGKHNMHFDACSGSLLGDINEGRPGRTAQTALIPSVDILTLTIGGNNLGFADVLRNCIYHPDFNTDYGKEYPDPDGMCFKSIAQARLWLTGFFFFIRGTVIGAAQAQRPTDWNRDDSDLFLFLTGYAHFFNVDTTDCNDWSFGAWPVPGDQHHPKLTKELREAINGLVHTVNDMYRMVPGSFDRRWTHTSFVDISPGFQGHRFCEPGVSLYDNYYSSDVWLWNLSPNTPSDWKDPNKPESDTNTYPEPNNALDRDWALFLDNLWIIRPEGLSYDINPGQGSYAHPSPEGSSGWPGLGTRIFHPKQGGHTSIKRSLIDAFAKAGVPGVSSPE